MLVLKPLCHFALIKDFSLLMSLNQVLNWISEKTFVSFVYTVEIPYIIRCFHYVYRISRCITRFGSFRISLNTNLTNLLIYLGLILLTSFICLYSNIPF